MNGLTHFLLARIAEDESMARAAKESEEHGDGDAGWVSPDFVIAECEAKRKMVETYERLWERAEEIRRAVGNEQSASARLLYAGAEMVIPYLALPYADHPDYDPAWRP